MQKGGAVECEGVFGVERGLVAAAEAEEVRGYDAAGGGW